MKKLIIVLLLLLLLGGGGGGAAYWYYFIRPVEAATVAEPDAPLLSQVELETLEITQIKNGKSQRKFYIQIVLVFDSPEKQALVQGVMPDVLDAINMELHQLVARKLVEQAQFDTEIIRQRAEKAVNRRIGPGYLYGLNIRNIAEYELR